MEWFLLHSQGSQQGFKGMAGMAYGKSGFSASSGICFFETDGYDTRIYSYEPDLLYGFSLPAFYGPGLHYYENLTGICSGLPVNLEIVFGYRPGSGGIGPFIRVLNPSAAVLMKFRGIENQK